MFPGILEKRTYGQSPVLESTSPLTPPSPDCFRCTSGYRNRVLHSVQSRFLSKTNSYQSHTPVNDSRKGSHKLYIISTFLRKKPHLYILHLKIKTLPNAIRAAIANISPIAKGKLERTARIFFGNCFHFNEPPFLLCGGPPPPETAGAPPGSGASILGFVVFFLPLFSEVLSSEITAFLLPIERVSVSVRPFLVLHEGQREGNENWALNLKAFMVFCNRSVDVVVEFRVFI